MNKDDLSDRLARLSVMGRIEIASLCAARVLPYVIEAWPKYESVMSRSIQECGKVLQGNIGSETDLTIIVAEVDNAVQEIVDAGKPGADFYAGEAIMLAIRTIADPSPTATADVVVCGFDAAYLKAAEKLGRAGELSGEEEKRRNAALENSESVRGYIEFFEYEFHRILRSEE